MAVIDVKVPDIGDVKDVSVIELLVQPGQAIQAEQGLVTVESDKASMEIPAPQGGVVKELKVKLGDKVNQGSVLLTLEAAASSSAAAAAPAAPTAEGAPPPHPSPSGGGSEAVSSPSGGGSEAVSSPSGEGSEAVSSPGGGGSEAAPVHQDAPEAAAPPPRTLPTAALPPHEPAAPAGPLPHASPSIRRAARELGVPLAEVQGSGPKGRITLEDLQGFVQRVMAGQVRTQAQAAAAPAAPAAAAGLPGLLPWPEVDFEKFGPVERKPLGRIRRIAGANLHRNWVLIPHVTNTEDADITELEALRVQLNKENEKAGIKVTLLAFLVKACAAALKKFPEFNASLDGEQLVYKQYFHIGFAADTPNGLVVPVIRDADRKGILQISQELNALAEKARAGKLSPAEMSGGCFSISSLGGIGGRYFTPIINAPEVAILGVCRSTWEPKWDGTAFQPRLMLPLSLSWDHRVIDGAAAARFNVYLASLLADFRRIAL